MRMAIRQALAAQRHGDVPVGAVVARGGEVVARGHNGRESRQDATLHAEIAAIRRACKKLGSWRLDGCTLYVTLEPCAMCAGAAVLARLGRIVYGAADPKAGACGTAMSVIFDPCLNHHPSITPNILESECARLLTGFFSALRAAGRGSAT